LPAAGVHRHTTGEQRDCRALVYPACGHWPAAHPLVLRAGVLRYELAAEQARITQTRLGLAAVWRAGGDLHHGFAGAGLQYFPIIIGQMDIWTAAAATDSLLFLLYGVAITLPAIIGYSIFVYRVFHGKATELSYE